MIATTRTDADLQRAVAEELDFDPRLDASDIVVGAKDGMISLTGSVEMYYEKTAAEEAAKHVAGVRGIANDLRIASISSDERTDTDLALAATEVLAARVDLPKTIQAVVKNGAMTLTGKVEWGWQRTSAETALHGLRGLASLTNFITVKPRVRPEDVVAKIEKAFERTAAYEAHRVHVDTHGGTVVLSGSVRTFAEKDEAGRTAWNVPGVTNVDNRIIVGF